MRWMTVLTVIALTACDDGGGASGVDAMVVDAAIIDAQVQQPLRRARVTHDFGEVAMQPFEEITNCVAWTLDNDEPIYIERIDFDSTGGFHHSNWFVVPETLYEGPDGFFNCRERGFDELSSAVSGTVIFAQSTQAHFETQVLGEGVVIKIPPRHKVVAGTHLLNLSAAPIRTGLKMHFELIHPEDVQVVVAPFRLDYHDLQIPPLKASRFRMDCNLTTPFESQTGRPLDLKLYYVLPHFHELGNAFETRIFGGPRDGELLHEFEQFNAEPNGKAFDPPIDLTGATGLSMTCGYDNPRREPVGYGIGDQEMCVMLGFADSPILMDAAVREDTEMVADEFGVARFTGPCVVTPVPKNAAQTMPTAAEMAAPMYVPPSDPVPDDPTNTPECIDTPDDATYDGPVTVDALRTQIFRPGCTFSACHGSSEAGGLNLSGEDVAEVLRTHTPTGNTTLKLVEPGDPEQSWLYQRVATCNPVDADGAPVTHMPLNSPRLLAPEAVALLRDWIAAGAPD